MKKIRHIFVYILPVVLTLSIMLVTELASHPAFVSEQPHTVDSASPHLGQNMFSFLWQYRGLDLIVQSFFLFAAIIGCIALLRGERRE